MFGRLIGADRAGGVYRTYHAAPRHDSIAFHYVDFRGGRGQSDQARSLYNRARAE
jgi:hypothetical protein